MFCFLFSYLQIMPSFLDFVFSFGNQEFLPDFHFTGFREESHLKSEHRALTIPQLGRSGSEMQLCYNLMSVEEFPVSVELPWSIRQVAVYHRLDFETGKSVWVTIKGNKVIKDRLSNLTKKWDASRFGSVAEAFTACLEVHLLLCNWSMANWRWYINDLQKLVQNFTRDSQSAPVGCTPGPQNPGFPCLSSPSPLSPPSRTVISHQPFRTMKRCIKSLAKKSTLSDFWKARERENGFSDTSRMEGDRRNISFFTQSSSGAGGPGELEESDTSGFGLGELQRIIFIEEKAQEVSKILQSNDRILEDLRQHYDYITNHAEIPQVAKDNGPDNIKFQNGIKRVKKELSFQQSSIEGLLRILEQRKGFVSCATLSATLQYQNSDDRHRSTPFSSIEAFGLARRSLERFKIHLIS
jgi:hypothetical protein